MKIKRLILKPFITAVILSTSPIMLAQSCDGIALSGVKGSTSSIVLTDGTLIANGKVNINIDGYARAYHPENASSGALIHLCNAGEVFLPDGTSYHGSTDNATCTGRFMDDVARIRTAGWSDPKIGLVRWYGILGRGEAEIAGRKVKNIVPVFQADGSGFYVSTTSYFDSSITDDADQRRYINPLRIPAAVVPDHPELRSRGIVMGSFGVAFDRDSKRAVSFVVGDYGPAVGEATPALARSLAGLSITDSVTRANRFIGQVDEARISWIFFGAGGGRISYDSKNEHLLVNATEKAFQKWGGRERLSACTN